MKKIKMLIFSNIGIEIHIFKKATSKICKEILAKRLLKNAQLKYFHSILLLLFAQRFRPLCDMLGSKFKGFKQFPWGTG